jgi:hypothetical protein
MATVPPPNTVPETPPMEPGPAPDNPGEIEPPTPDIDIPDPGGPGDPGENPPLDEAEGHPS